MRDHHPKNTRLSSPEVPKSCPHAEKAKNELQAKSEESISRRMLSYLLHFFDDFYLHVKISPKTICFAAVVQP